MGFWGRLGYDLQHPVKALFPQMPDMAEEIRKRPKEMAEAIGVIGGAIGFFFAAKAAGEELGKEAAKELNEKEE